ncbi:MAG: hypothetical protein AABM33_04195 [Pseudomonadota bacterium]
MAFDGGEAGHEHLDLAAEQVLHGLAAALVVDVHDVDAGARAEQFAGEVPGAAVPGGGVVDAPGARLGERDEFADIRRRHARMHDHQQRHLRDARDRGEVFLRIERELFVDAGVDGHGAVVAHHQV